VRMVASLPGSMSIEDTLWQQWCITVSGSTK
jgi:hypothetical protein